MILYKKKPPDILTRRGKLFSETWWPSASFFSALTAIIIIEDLVHDPLNHKHHNDEHGVENRRLRDVFLGEIEVQLQCPDDIFAAPAQKPQDTKDEGEPQQGGNHFYNNHS